MSAIVIKGGSILSIGHNRVVESDPKGIHNCSIHAEMDAINSARSTLKGSKILVFRFSRLDDTLYPSKPCEHCASIIRAAQISWVYYVSESTQAHLIKCKPSEL